VSSRLLTQDVWPHLARSAARFKKPSFVAVAYFGKGGADLLPLKRGSTLVVDASEEAVRSGQTSPEELLKLYKKGVRVHSVRGLHAKVYVIGKEVFIGSANVSRNSRDNLREVLVLSRDESLLRAAKAFVRSLMTVELGENELDRLKKIYAKRARKPRGEKPPRRNKGPRVFVSQFTFHDTPKGEEASHEKGAKAARRLLSKSSRHQMDSYHCSKESSWSWKRGDLLVPVEMDSSWRPKRIYSIERVIHKRHGQKHRFFYVEAEKDAPTSRFTAAQKQLSRKAVQHLRRDGMVRNSEIAEELIRFCSET
jgi:hypothetical protein